ncbi:MAG: hypothetical protein AAF206_03450 [Bacteroidota bacterium]
MNHKRFTLWILILLPATLLAQETHHISLRANLTLFPTQDQNGALGVLPLLAPAIAFAQGNVRHQVEINRLVFRSRPLIEGVEAGTVRERSFGFRYQLDYLFHAALDEFSPFLGVAIAPEFTRTGIESPTANFRNVGAVLRSDVLLGVRVPLGKKFQFNLAALSVVYFRSVSNLVPSNGDRVRLSQEGGWFSFGNATTFFGLRTSLAMHL